MIHNMPSGFEVIEDTVLLDGNEGLMKLSDLLVYLKKGEVFTKTHDAPSLALALYSTKEDDFGCREFSRSEIESYANQGFIKFM